MEQILINLTTTENSFALSINGTLGDKFSDNGNLQKNIEFKKALETLVRNYLEV